VTPFWWPQVWRALGARGIGPGSLYVHQTEAIDALLQRQHTAVCTSTASGKSLCYNVPILQARSACLLVLFPAVLLAMPCRCCVPSDNLRGSDLWTCLL
jgi:ATP-dependent helicase YprA (DUF1998 family)